MPDNSLQGGSDLIRDIDKGSGVKTQVFIIDQGGAGAESLVSLLNPMKIDSDGISLLKRILQSLKSLGVRTGNGSNRLSVDVNSGNVNVAQATAANLNANVGTVGNQTNIGGISAWAMVKSMNRTGYNTGIRTKLG